MASLRERLAAAKSGETQKKKFLLSDPCASSLPPTSEPLAPLREISRLLGQTEADVPFDFPTSDDPFPRSLIRRVMQTEASQLGIWIDPKKTGNEAWIALRLSANDVALLFPLPLLNQPSQTTE